MKQGKDIVKSWQQRAEHLAAGGADGAGGCLGTGDVQGTLDRSSCSLPCSSEWERTKGKLWALKPQYQSSREEGNYSGALQAGSSHSMVVLSVDHHWSCCSAGRPPAPPTPLLHMDVSVCGCWIRSLFLASFRNLMPVQGLWSLGVVGEIAADLFHHLFFHLQVSRC